MTLWLVRGGKYGEHEQRFIDNSRLYLTWDGLKHDLGNFTEKQQLSDTVAKLYPESSAASRAAGVAQIWAFARSMNVGDWVIVPFKSKPAINVGEITGEYTFDPEAENPYYHSRAVRWVGEDVPRTNFDKDLLHSINGARTIFRIERNDAEKRVRAMASAGWKSALPALVPGVDESDGDAGFDIEQAARDQIAKLIIARYKGHGLARLVDAVLRADGYTTYVSPEGPDKGIDILAARGPLGFEQPRICVQVKSGDVPVDSPTLNQLIGSMANVQADQGLLVSWGGFRSSVDRERATQFFRVRLWDQRSIIDEVFSHYDRLDDEFRAELPLKKIWVVADDASGDREDPA